ncbi:hypothetical protein GCM10025863_00520 [Microbacterium suwonense]|uniref:Uncharacterized protein n=1 Tax=Microbacterium suwonense TaxID=683047 RepID=A0ABM8FNY8_9MICO|nr:hypothetical protein GCM10025863_00520 [Microbacterium suwonense]
MARPSAPSSDTVTRFTVVVVACVGVLFASEILLATPKIIAPKSAKTTIAKTTAANHRYPRMRPVIAIPRPRSPVRRICDSPMWPNTILSGPVGRKEKISANKAIVFNGAFGTGEGVDVSDRGSSWGAAGWLNCVVPVNRTINYLVAKYSGRDWSADRPGDARTA